MSNIERLQEKKEQARRYIMVRCYNHEKKKRNKKAISKRDRTR